MALLFSGVTILYKLLSSMRFLGHSLPGHWAFPDKRGVPAA